MKTHRNGRTFVARVARASRVRDRGGPLRSGRLGVALAAWIAIAGGSACRGKEACRPGSVLLTVSCGVQLAGVDTAHFAISGGGSDDAGVSKDLGISCPGSTSLEIDVTAYGQAQTGLRARVSLSAGAVVRAQSELVDVALTSSCVAQTITLGEGGSPDGAVDAPGSGQAGVGAGGASAHAGGSGGNGGADGGAIVGGSGGSVTAPDGAAPDGMIAVIKKDSGLACASQAECKTGFCVDSVCCESLCTTMCMGCSAARTGGKDGTCAMATAGIADPACVKGNSTCGQDGTCDGAGACRKAGPKTSCAPATCNSGVATSASLCDGQGNCKPSNGTSSCDPFVCVDGTGCKTTCTTSADCVGPRYCNNDMCQAKKADGVACGTSEECVTGSCVTFYVDGDGDGYGDDSRSVKTCNKAPAGATYVLTGGDCCDSDALVNPGQVNYFSKQDACFSFDYNCNNKIDFAAGPDSTNAGAPTTSYKLSQCSGMYTDQNSPCGTPNISGGDWTESACGTTQTFEVCTHDSMSADCYPHPIPGWWVTCR